MKAREAKITEPALAEPPKKAKDRQQEAMDNFAQVFQKHQSKVILKPTLATGQRRSTRVRYQVEPMQKGDGGRKLPLSAQQSQQQPLQPGDVSGQQASKN